MKAKEEEAAALKAKAEAAEGEQKAALEAEEAAAQANIEKERAALAQNAADQQKNMLAAALKQKMLEAELNRIERELTDVLPLVNEANLAAQELDRKVVFNTKIVKRLDPFLKDGQGG